MKELSSPYLSAFCRELVLLVRAGIPLGEGIRLMDESGEGEAGGLLAELGERLDEGLPLSSALEAAEGFPGYFLGLIRLGEASGRLEEALTALGRYYENKQTLSDNLRRAVVYPLLLLGLLSAVAVVVITRVLPVFYQMLHQVGVQMSGLALSLMSLGRALTSASAVLLAILALLACLGLLAWKSPTVRGRLLPALERRWGDKGIFGRLARSRFAMAMAMAISSGLHPEEAISLAGGVCGERGGMAARAERCRALLEQGESLEHSLSQTRLFSARDCRLLALGVKAGETDAVMDQIARQGEERVLDELDRKLSLVEPALVIIMSLMVGLVLFSVMLPLMGVMSSLG